jgi:hypothetical protein
MKSIVTIVLTLLAVGCSQSTQYESAFEPLSVEWRSAGDQVLTEDEATAVVAAKRHMADDIRGLKVAFDASDSADFSHVEFTAASQTNGQKIVGNYIALYHSTGKLNGFPEGYFTLLVYPDGTVTNLHEGWE